MPYNSLIELIQKFSPVAAGNTNRPTRELFENVEFLKALIEDTLLSTALILYDQTLDPAVLPGQPVYLDVTTEAFKPALAGAETVSGAVVPTAQSKVIGVVLKKTNATLGDILIYGVRELDLSHAVVGNVALTEYYLSGTTPGMLTAQQPPVSVLVMRTLPGGKVLVVPQVRDFLDQHVHYNFDLACKPAGRTHEPALGEPHVVFEADVDLMGWLPAYHASFNGKAPHGAQFGYNLNAHPGLKNAWPPIPLSAAWLELDRAFDATQGFQGVPLGEHRQCLLDSNGLWWMTDCYGDVPWPTDYESDDDPNAEFDSETSEGSCPRKLHFAMKLWFNRLTFQTARGVVTSLESGDDRLQVVCAPTGLPAAVGPLKLLLNLSLLLSDVIDDLDPLAIKGLDDTGHFLRGPVVVAIKSDNNRLAVSGGTVLGDYRFGQVTLTANPLASLELPIQLVRVMGVTQEAYPAMFLGFSAARESSYDAKIDVPFDLEAGSCTLKLRLWLLGRAAGTLPTLSCTYRRVPRPDNLLVDPLDFPLEDTNLTIDTSTAVVTADQYVEAESEAFTVAPGDTVYFHVQRSNADGYAGELGVLRQYGALSLT